MLATLILELILTAVQVLVAVKAPVLHHLVKKEVSLDQYQEAQQNREANLLNQIDQVDQGNHQMLRMSLAANQTHQPIPIDQVLHVVTNQDLQAQNHRHQEVLELQNLGRDLEVDLEVQGLDQEALDHVQEARRAKNRGHRVLNQGHRAQNRDHRALNLDPKALNLDHKLQNPDHNLILRVENPKVVLDQVVAAQRVENLDQDQEVLHQGQKVQ